jgi:hypothetical protein
VVPDVSKESLAFVFKDSGFMNFFILIQKHEMRQAHLFFFETNYQDKKTDLILKTRVKLLKKSMYLAFV